MRDGRQKLVFQPIRLLGFDAQRLLACQQPRAFFFGTLHGAIGQRVLNGDGGGLRHGEQLLLIQQREACAVTLVVNLEEAEQIASGVEHGR